MEIPLYQRITKHCLLVLEDSSTAKTLFAVLSIAAFAIMVGISNNGMALSSSASLFTVNKDIHKVHLSINIIDPALDSTITSNVILVNGTSFGHANGVQKVEVFAHAYPFRDTFNFKPAKPISEGNWSKWSIPILVNTTGVYRILAHVTDNQGNQNWTEVKIFVPIVSSSTGQAAVQGSPSQIKKIAIVLSSFTETAYSPHAFYTFYNKYGSIPIQQDVKTDLDMLNPPIQYCTYIRPPGNKDVANLSLHCPADPEDRFIIILAEHLQKIIPHVLVTIIRDEDIHNGYIFTSNMSHTKNAYDLLILTHDEYATQTMYNNYKRFVSNGGTLLALDGNIFYAEIKYNKNNNTITLLKGHSWQFDGNSAKRDVRERWFNQNSEWVGSNFLESDIKDNITFKNNPFNYTHFEENFVNNPNDKILINYGAVIPKQNPFQIATVATYELDFLKGKVIMIGLYGQNLVDNETFLRFLESLVLKLA
jgi:hypothetical protein